MYKFCCILILMVFGGRVSAGKDTDITGNYDNDNTASGSYDYNDIYYPDGYQNWHSSLKRTGFDFRQLPPITSRQFTLAGNLPLIAAVGGVSTLHYGMEGLNHL